MATSVMASKGLKYYSEQHQQQQQHHDAIITAKPYTKGNVVTLFEHNNKFPPTFNPKPEVSSENVFLKSSKNSNDVVRNVVKNVEPKNNQNYVPIETLTFQGPKL